MCPKHLDPGVPDWMVEADDKYVEHAANNYDTPVNFQFTVTETVTRYYTTNNQVSIGALVDGEYLSEEDMQDQDAIQDAAYEYARDDGIDYWDADPEYGDGYVDDFEIDDVQIGSQ